MPFTLLRRLWDAKLEKMGHDKKQWYQSKTRLGDISGKIKKDIKLLKDRKFAS